jgi:hypothetical protein
MRLAIGLSVFLLLGAWPAATQAPGPLASVEPGLWALRGANGEALGNVCLGDPTLLAQPVTSAAQPCTRQVISSDLHSATISYVCPGLGRGQAVLRVETPRLVQIDSQGLSRGVPFALRSEARKIGPCPGN